MISILSDLEIYGSDLELEYDHRWVAIIDEATRNGFFVLVGCAKCGLLARKGNSSSWELSTPSDDRWRMSTLKDCPGHIDEIN